MILHLKYFGMIAEAIGLQDEEFDFSLKTVSELDKDLVNKYTKLKLLNYKFAVNQNMVACNTILKNNDEIALLPPFAGG